MASQGVGGANPPGSATEGAARWSATGFEPQGRLAPRGSIPPPSAHALASGRVVSPLSSRGRFDSCRGCHAGVSQRLDGLALTQKIEVRILAPAPTGYAPGSQQSLARTARRVRVPDTPPSPYSSMERALGYGPRDRRSNRRRGTPSCAAHIPSHGLRCAGGRCACGVNG